MGRHNSAAACSVVQSFQFRPVQSILAVRSPRSCRQTFAVGQGGSDDFCFFLFLSPRSPRLRHSLETRRSVLCDRWTARCTGLIESDLIRRESRDGPSEEQFYTVSDVLR